MDQVFLSLSLSIFDPTACCIQHSQPGPYLAINRPSLALSVAMAMVDHAVFTAVN
jgi:hypothetical protein